MANEWGTPALARRPLARPALVRTGPTRAGATAARKADLVRSAPPRPAPPEVRCLIPGVPVRRGWGVLLTGAAAAVAVIERARGAGLLVSGPGRCSAPQ